MANYPHWINKKSSATTASTSSLSPRQVANKAYSLAIKKLDRDDKIRRPHYTVRERLLLSNTMTKAEDLLNKRTPRSNRRVLASEFDDDVSICPPATNIPPPAPFQCNHYKKSLLLLHQHKHKHHQQHKHSNL